MNLPNMPRWPEDKIKTARELRATGHTLTEITQLLTSLFGKTSYSRVWDYIKAVPIMPEFRPYFNKNRASSTRRAIDEWSEAVRMADTLLSSRFALREYLLIASMLYWAEGNKKDLCISNGNPLLLQSFKRALQAALDIPDERFSFSLLLYTDLDHEKCISYWSQKLGLHRSQLTKVWVRAGKEKGKLPYGIGILRLRQPRKELKILSAFANSIITLLEPRPHSSMDRTRES